MNREGFIDAFNNIKNRGWIQSLRHGATGIGYTLETLMGINENNNDTPDLFGFEIKTHREMTSDSYVTLFTKAPNIPRRRANRLLLETCGNIDNGYPVLHASVFAHRSSNVYNTYNFQLCVNQSDIMFLIRRNDENIIDNIGWSKDVLQQTMERKMNNLALITAMARHIDNIEYFKYTSCTLYYNISFNSFIDLLIQGNIMVDIRLGTHRFGRNAGRVHDHGSAFRIKQRDILQLYDCVENI